MIVVLQRVTQAKVDIDEKTVGQIGKGLMVLVCAEKGDTDEKARLLAQRLLRYRVFEDENGKMNLSLLDIEGELLIVPNFTLYGDARKGRRPGYSSGAAPEIASELFDKLCAKAEALGIKKVQHGIFQTDMKVALVNDGPVTLLLDSEKLF